MFKNILDTFANCFKIPELKSRIFYTLLVLVICRVVSMIPIPGLDGQALSKFFEDNAARSGNSLLGMYSMFTGGALRRMGSGARGLYGCAAPYTITLVTTTATTTQTAICIFALALSFHLPKTFNAGGLNIPVIR